MIWQATAHFVAVFTVLIAIVLLITHMLTVMFCSQFTSLRIRIRANLAIEATLMICRTVTLTKVMIIKYAA